MTLSKWFEWHWSHEWSTKLETLLLLEYCDIIASMSLPHPFLNFLLVSFKMLKNLSLSPQKHTVTHARILNITVWIYYEGLMKNNESVQCWKNEVWICSIVHLSISDTPNAFAFNKGKPHVRSHRPFWFFASFVDLIF